MNMAAFRPALALSLLAVVGSTSSFAGFSIPRGVFEVEQLSDAMREAQEKGKAVALLLSDPDTTCPLSANASTNAMDEISRHSVVVLLRSGSQWKRELPPPLVRALNSEVTGRIIPRLAVASPNLGSVWATMRYENLKDSRALRGLRGTVTDIAEGRAGAPETDPVQRWTLKDGRFYQGTFLGIEGDQLALKVRDSGNEVRLPLSEYAPGTILYAKTLAGHGDPAPEHSGTTEAADVIHEWSSSDGRILRAAFVGLDGSTLSLRGEGGETFRVELARLNEASRAQARSLTAK